MTISYVSVLVGGPFLDKSSYFVKSIFLKTLKHDVIKNIETMDKNVFLLWNIKLSKKP